MNNPRVGELIFGKEERDAIHVAIAPVVAAERLYPGQHIGLDANGKATSKSVLYIGIVDPYITGGIVAGDKFWMFLYPSSIKSIRHDWTHPAFDQDKTAPQPKTKSKSEAYLESFAAGADLTLNELLYSVAEYLQYDRYLIDGGKYEGRSVPDEFWQHYEEYTGIKVPYDKRYNFFDCSC